MSNAHRVDLDRLIDVIDRMARVQTELEGAVDEVATQSGRVCAAWAGTAADEHDATHQRWQRAAREMHAALGAMRRIGQGAHDNYAAAAAANAGMWTL